MTAGHRIEGEGKGEMRKEREIQGSDSKLVTLRETGVDFF